MVGVEDVEGAVLLEGVIMSGVEEVEVILEEISNDLESLLHDGVLTPDTRSYSPRSQKSHPVPPLTPSAQANTTDGASKLEI